ncbi:hypothetical protein [Frankia sp. Allo2]|nr:hypothetical protein [Frankia sp. Allo2]
MILLARWQVTTAHTRSSPPVVSIFALSPPGLALRWSSGGDS